MAERIAIDVEPVLEIAGRLRGLAEELTSAAERFDDDGSLHSRVIDDALGDFNGDWSDKRRTITEALEGSAGFLENVVEQLTAADDQLAEAAAGGE